eukprot:scaffold16713_cov118-Skeletonema_marinoi.AAC.3
MRARARGWGSLFSDGLVKRQQQIQGVLIFRSSRFKVPINFPAHHFTVVYETLPGIGLGTGLNYRHLLR